MDNDGRTILDPDDIYPPSPLSSSPPREFDINFEDQYIPIKENDNESSSLASSLSFESDNVSSPGLSGAKNSAKTMQNAVSGSSRVIRCPVCEKPMRTFYCAKCIQRGQFVTLEHHDQAKHERNIRNNHNIEQPSPEPETSRDNVVDPHKVSEEMLLVRLRTLKKKIEVLESIYKDRKLKLDETRETLRATRQEVEEESSTFRNKQLKIDLIKRYISSRKISVKKRRDEELNLLDELKQRVSRQVYYLTQDIFPIEKVDLLEQNSSFINMETSPLLTFSDGSHHQIEQSTAYSIVEPWLPSSGDYSSYSLWVNDNKDRAPVNECSGRENPAMQIGAALAYTTQLVKNIASYLDVILPIPMALNMFNGELLNDAMFSYNVAKLNVNVIHLCVSQGIDISLLNSQRTLKNLLLLFDINICDLGRKPIFDLENDELALKMEKHLSKDLTLIVEDFYDPNKFAANSHSHGYQMGNRNQDDEDDVSDSEWEISDSINPMEMHRMAAEQQSSIQQNSYISRPFKLFSSFWTASGN